MSSSVSQIEYWLGTNKNNSDANQKSNGKEGGDGATYLSYNVFLGLAVIGGFFALDHLYLRSPLTFVAKLAINVMFFGVWWLWDALQAVFNRDIIKVFGIGIPGMGPKGIAAGVLGNDVADKKHMRFFIYAISIICVGMFGVDSFLVGDRQSGLIRLISLITVIFAPVAIGWWIYKLFKFFFNTKAVTTENYEYFGAPAPPALPSVAEQIKSSIPILGSLISPLVKIKDATVSAVEDVGEFAEGIITNPGAAIDSILTGPAEKLATFISPIVQPFANVATAAIKPITDTVQIGLQTVDDVAGTARESLALGRNVFDKGSALLESGINTFGETAKAVATAASLVPAAGAISGDISESAIKSALAEQTGGASNSNVLPFVLMGTLAIIAVSGFILTYRRSRQNVKPRKDDSPPNPETPISRVL